MLDIELPAELVGNIQNDYEIARGPFVAVHNGIAGVGAYMTHNGPYVTFWDGSRTQSLDETYKITGSGTNRVVARSAEYNSSFLFRPLELSDGEWLFADGRERPNSLEDLVYTVRDALSEPF